jgi:chromosomal replication initiator protein
MRNLEQYRTLRKALEILAEKTPEEIQNMIDLIAKGSMEDVIIEEVTKYFKVSLEELKRRSRKREIVEPRQIAMYLLIRNTKLTRKQVANMFNKECHSTVIHAINAVENNMFYEDTRRKVEDIQKRVDFMMMNKSETV